MTKKRAAMKKGEAGRDEADGEDVDHTMAPEAEAAEVTVKTEVGPMEEEDDVKKEADGNNEITEQMIEAKEDNLELKVDAADDTGATLTADVMIEDEALASSMAAEASVENLEVAHATAAAIEAAVAASDQAAVVAAVVAVTQEASPYPTDRDVILGDGSAGHKTNLLLQDIIRLHRILWKLHEKPLPSSEEEVAGMVDHIIGIIKSGKQLELAGLKDVPKPFMKSAGRFFGKVPETGAWAILEDEQLKTIMTEIILDEFKVDDLGPLTTTPYKDLKEWMSKVTTHAAATEFLPEAKDAILLPVDNEAEKMYESQQGNKTLFHLASQLVTSHTNAPDKRVEAALSIMKGLDETLESMESSGSSGECPTTTKSARFLIRDVRDDRTVAWDLMDPASAAEFTVIFVFEVFLEKEIHITDPTSLMYSATGDGEFDADDDEAGKPSLDPIAEPTDHDVLFGRGGMTNSHAGNRRFRDVIALHRPDYIRAIKLDKPGVARKIVKAIRQGIPPGRFLKKMDDGFFYDVGDRTAAEKTSQGLRERTNAEKRQRSALREALRIRKEDMVEDDNGDDSNKKLKTEGEPTLNYAGTNLPVPLSLSMKDASFKTVVTKIKKLKPDKGSVVEELNCEGLPPNAVDEEGNVLVTDYDILCGRGGLTNHHKGNKRFRDIVALHRPDYVRAPKIQKPSVARVIVRAIRNGDPPGRFLRKDERIGRWVDIGDKKAAEKTSQALREKISDERESPEAKAILDSSLGTSVLLPSPASYLADTFPTLLTTATECLPDSAGEVAEAKAEGDGDEKNEAAKHDENEANELDDTAKTAETDVQTMSV